MSIKQLENIIYDQPEPYKSEGEPAREESQTEAHVYPIQTKKMQRHLFLVAQDTIKKLHIERADLLDDRSDLELFNDTEISYGNLSIMSLRNGERIRAIDERLAAMAQTSVRDY